jgi:ergothioneine biosynthesis protein EgtB
MRSAQGKIQMISTTAAALSGQNQPLETADNLDHSVGARYRAVRARTEALCEPLETEDYVVSTMTDVSPTKWHIAHTSWFFEKFVLSEFDTGYRSIDPRYAFLFNSYYVQAGERHCRAQRGLATRPTVKQVFEYRAHVDAAMAALIDRISGDSEHPALPIIEIGLNHEQQHQELLLMDIRHVFWMNPLRPAYVARVDKADGSNSRVGGEALGALAPQASDTAANVSSQSWSEVPEGIHMIGHQDLGFAYDNEGPAHRVYLNGFRLASHLVTNAEYLKFIEDGGYTRAELWLSNGWATVQEHGWDAPLYWERAKDGWTEFTLHGSNPLRPADPVSSISYFEADAYARWAGARLPTEAEWEVAARSHPGIPQLYGNLWQFTQSPYIAYPGYTPAPGAIGEYNGKWMCDQWVLRGSSFGTPDSHSRVTYRNFFPANARWHFGGIRLAADA